MSYFAFTKNARTVCTECITVKSSFKPQPYIKKVYRGFAILNPSKILPIYIACTTLLIKKKLPHAIIRFFCFREKTEHLCFAYVRQLTCNRDREQRTALYKRLLKYVSLNCVMFLESSVNCACCNLFVCFFDPRVRCLHIYLSLV